MVAFHEVIAPKMESSSMCCFSQAMWWGLRKEKQPPTMVVEFFCHIQPQFVSFFTHPTNTFKVNAHYMHIILRKFKTTYNMKTNNT
jgi:hypothetical protein